ncbi:MAG: DUF4189 domain-containing protein [Alphaproteobacteria bacterium]|nr:DUF4189 domain-containing protein [Alphaproteobacteria bacterium]
MRSFVIVAALTLFGPVASDAFVNLHGAFAAEGKLKVNNKALRRMGRPCRNSYNQFLRKPGFGAFAVARNGACGFSWDHNSAKSAREGAIKECQKLGRKCGVAAVRWRPEWQLASTCQENFRDWQRGTNTSAFAVGRFGWCGWSNGSPSLEEAKQQALAGCRKYGPCRILKTRDSEPEAQVAGVQAEQKHDLTSRRAANVDKEAGREEKLKPHAGLSQRFRGIDLSGEWAYFTARTDRGNVFRPYFEVSIYPHKFAFRVIDDKRVEVKISNGGKVSTVELKAPKHNYLLSIEKSDDGKVFFPRFLKLLYDEHGVTLLAGHNEMYLVRFSEMSKNLSGSIHQMPPEQFCQGPASEIAAFAASEIQTLKRLKSSSRFYSNFDESKAAAIGLFDFTNFQKVFGIPLEGADDRLWAEILERLKYCSVLHFGSTESNAVATALFVNPLKESIRGFLPERHSTFKGPNIQLRMSVSQFREFGEKVASARSGLDGALAQISGEVDQSIRRRRIEEILRDGSSYVAPSKLAEIVEKLERDLEISESNRAKEREAFLDRTQPARPQNELIDAAARGYFLDNCSKAFLAAQATKQGRGVLGVALSRSVEAVDGQCVITIATHILKLSVRAVNSDKCSGDGEAFCNFDLYWSCRFDLNPEFGFSADVANIDPICPVLGSVPVSMRGTFERTAPRRWTVRQLEW